MKTKLKKGYLIVESVAACALFAGLLAAVVYFFSASTEQRRALDQRRFALREATNIMEKIYVLPWEELDKAAAADFVESELAELRKDLDAVEIKIEIEPAEAVPVGKRLLLSLGWRDAKDQPVQPVCLTAWRYRP